MGEGKSRQDFEKSLKLVIDSRDSITAASIIVPSLLSSGKDQNWA